MNNFLYAFYFLINFLKGHNEITFSKYHKNGNCSWCAQKCAINECKINFVTRKFSYLHSFNFLKLHRNASIENHKHVRKWKYDCPWHCITSMQQFDIAFIVAKYTYRRWLKLCKINNIYSDMQPINSNFIQYL